MSPGFTTISRLGLSNQGNEPPGPAMFDQDERKVPMLSATGYPSHEPWWPEKYSHFVGSGCGSGCSISSWCRKTGDLENQLLLISINFTPKTSHSCLKKWYFPRFSREEFLTHHGPMWEGKTLQLSYIYNIHYYILPLQLHLILQYGRFLQHPYIYLLVI